MKRLILATIAALIAIPVLSQEAEEITRILKKTTADRADFSYLVASGADFDGTPEEAYAWCARFGTFPADGVPSAPATAKIISHFFMTNYGLKGGFMWSLTGNARYAYKELKYSGFWKPGTDPDAVFSGRDLVRAVRDFYVRYPDARLVDKEAEK